MNLKFEKNVCLSTLIYFFLKINLNTNQGPTPPPQKTTSPVIIRIAFLNFSFLHLKIDVSFLHFKISNVSNILHGFCSVSRHCRLKTQQKLVQKNTKTITGTLTNLVGTTPTRRSIRNPMMIILLVCFFFLNYCQI